MLSPTGPDPGAPEPPLDPHRVDPGAADPFARRAALVCGLVATLAALLFPFAPVQQPVVTYTWPDGPPTAAALPLLPYQPVELTATVTCAAARAAGPGGAVLATVPPRPDPAAAPLAGLVLAADGDRLRVRSAGVDLGAVPLPAGPCTVTVTSTFDRTAVVVDGVEALARTGDVRPAVAGVFPGAAADGVALSLVADTRFQTTITGGKAALGAGCLLALAGLAAALRRADARAVPRRVRLLAPAWWRPRPVDAAVTAVLGLWWLTGPITVDDGYIAGIVRGRDATGFIGNAYRWLNAPEAPFSWFYELYHLLAQASPATPWLRLPSTLLGVLCWVLLSRAVLPRLGRSARTARASWLAAVAFLAWWLPFNLGLRPEPWVAVGTLAAWVAAERAIATRRMLPLVVGLGIAAATTAITPGGLMAFAPFLAGAVPLLRRLRARRDLHRLPVLAALAAAPAAALLLMTADQSIAAVLEAVRVRGVIGGGAPWYQEYERYATLLDPASFQGAIGRRAAVLLTLLAAATVLLGLARRLTRDVARGPARRLVFALLLALAVLTPTPTKWTQHFGDVAGLGAAVLLLGLLCAGPVLRGTGARSGVLGIGLVAVVGALVLAGRNAWPYASAWFPPTWSTVPPFVGAVPIATIALVAGVLVAFGIAAATAWRRAGGQRAERLPRRVPDAGVAVAILLVAVVALQAGSFARVALEQPGGYTLASDARATFSGDPCGLQPDVLVEPDPATGVLPARPGPGLVPTDVDVGGTTLPGVAVAGTGSSAWAALPGDALVVVTVTGRMRAGEAVALEFRRPGAPPQQVPVTAEPPAEETLPPVSDVRVRAPGDAEAVRLTVDATQAPPTAAVTLPRVPVLRPMAEVVPPGTVAVLDWPVAFLFGCLTPAPLPAGTADLPGWRVGPPQADPAAGITYAPAFGGPFAAARLLVTERRMPGYLRTDLLRDPVQLYRWTPVQPLRRLTPTVAVEEAPGWAARGRTRVPGLDPVG